MSFGGFLSGYYDVEGQLPAYLQKKAYAYFVEEERIKSDIKTVEAFEKRRNVVRQYFIDAIGGLDIERTPLNPVCTGVIDKSDYQIKKIIFQSQPSVYVTSNLYIPRNIKDKAPAVLFACGHAQTAKACSEYQKVCIDLVRNGFVVLAVDPVGQGERMQYYDKIAGRTLVSWGTTEHSYAGLQCDLTGSSIARYFVWDLIRALDYLCSLPEVDEQKIGMTGNSGGGTQTSYMMLVDDRIKVAIPCTFITSRESYMKTGQAHDSEQNIFGAIAEGLNYDDFISCFAPKPVMIGAVESDFFCIEGTLQSYKRAKCVYDLYNSSDKLKLCIVKGTHAYNDELRQAAVNWFIEHLKGENANFVTDVNMYTEDPVLLQCTRCGQVMGEFDDAKSVYDLNVEYMKKHKYQITDDISVIKANVEQVLNMPKGREEIHPRVIATHVVEDIRYSDIFFFSEPDIAVAGIYINKAGCSSDTCTVLLLDEGTKSMVAENDLIKMLLKQGDVFVFDPRGVGAVQSRCINPRLYLGLYGTEYKLNSDAIMMKTSLCALRVYDVLRACDFVRQEHPAIKIRLAGKGISAIYALLACVIDESVQELYLEDMISSFEDIVSTKYYHYDTRLDIYGVLKNFDIPELLNVLKNKNVTCFHSPDIGNTRKV